jgi:hypothetical protein
MNVGHNKISKPIVAVVAICAIAVLIVGCETSTTSDVTISPSSVLLDAAKVSVVTFTASGGNSNYTWSLENTTLGTIYTADDTALYQNTTNTGTNYITVTDSSSNSASAVITQN